MRNRSIDLDGMGGARRNRGKGNHNHNPACEKRKFNRKKKTISKLQHFLLILLSFVSLISFILPLP